MAQLPFLVKHFVESVELLQWSRLQGPGFDIIDARTFALAAGSRSENLGVMRYLEGCSCPWDRTAFARAAMQGNLKALKWLQSRMGQPCHAGGCSHLQNAWDKEILNTGHTLCASDAGGGHVEVLAYLREQGIQWGKWSCPNAAAGGHLEALKWLRASGCPWELDPGFELNGAVSMTNGYAVEGGHVVEMYRLNQSS